MIDKLDCFNIEAQLLKTNRLQFSLDYKAHNCQYFDINF